MLAFILKSLSLPPPIIQSIQISGTTNNQTITSQQPELHKVLLKPAPDCWQYALSFLASQPDGANYAKILGDDDSLLEFERQLIVSTCTGNNSHSLFYLLTRCF